MNRFATCIGWLVIAVLAKEVMTIGCCAIRNRVER
jgi:hypothetical protein